MTKDEMTKRIDDLEDQLCVERAMAEQNQLNHATEVAELRARIDSLTDRLLAFFDSASPIHIRILRSDE